MQKKYVPLVVFLAALLVLAAHLGARAVLAETAFTFAEEEKRVYLTFDDGPSTVVTNAILDTLKEEGIKATFFIVSDRAHGREETLRRIVREGHTVGVHSATHNYSDIYASDEALLADVNECATLIRRVTGVVPHVYRFPGGGTSARERQTKMLERLGYRVVRWNAVCGDEEIRNASAATLTEESMRTAGDKNTVVLLLHDSAPHRATAEALPDIISRFRARGYTFFAY